MQQMASAFRRIARGFDDLARAIIDENETSRTDRAAAAMAMWGTRGLSQGQSSDLFKKNGFSPQSSGGWARGGWIEMRDGLRYLTPKSFDWLERRADGDRDEGPF